MRSFRYCLRVENFSDFIRIAFKNKNYLYGHTIGRYINDFARIDRRKNKIWMCSVDQFFSRDGYLQSELNLYQSMAKTCASKQMQALSIVYDVLVVINHYVFALSRDLIHFTFVSCTLTKLKLNKKHLRSGTCGT